MKNIRFTSFRPSGNDTALVAGIPLSLRERKRINNSIQNKYPTIEQVGFINLDKKNPILCMAGGEFCGNATRCAVWQVLEGKTGEVLMNVSGVKQKLRAGVTTSGEAFAQMPIYPEVEKVTQDTDTGFIVQMQGITHYVELDKNATKKLTAEEIKVKAMKVIKEKNLDQYPAAGVIYTSRIGSRFKIDPVVYVKAIDTLFYETACGSGTTAFGLVLTLQRKRSITNVLVIQPSGLPISVSIEFDGKDFIYAQIQGKVEKLQQDTIVTDTYKQLEAKMVKYKDLIDVPVKENKDQFIALEQRRIPNKYLPAKADMNEVLGKKMIVRRSVYERLLKAQNILRKNNPHLSLFVTYGYRSLEIQTASFLEHLKNTIVQFYDNPTDLYEEVHRSIAVPTVSGHPTGGAVDITIFDTKAGKFLEFGTKQYDYSTKDYYVFSPTISNAAKKNRMLLRDVMVNAGFAPFDGEWWHFSYGDREWAFYYKKNSAVYEQKPFIEVM